MKKALNCLRHRPRETSFLSHGCWDFLYVVTSVYLLCQVIKILVTILVLVENDILQYILHK